MEKNIKLMINLRRRLSLHAFYLSSGLALEAAAYPKPGNVHRLHDFSDIKFEDFLIASGVSQMHMLRGLRRGMLLAKGIMLVNVYGDLIKDIVTESMRISGGGNTNLGSSLLLVPLSIALGYLRVNNYEIELKNLLITARDLLRKYSTINDAVNYYKAVRAASPSYIRATDNTGEMPNVWDPEFISKIRSRGITLWNVISFSSMYDLNSNEVVQGYPRSLELTIYLLNRLRIHGEWNRAIVETYIYQLSRENDPVIVRKYGSEEAAYVRDEARKLMHCVDDWLTCREKVAALDEKLYERKVNPGSTADLIAVVVSLYSLWRQRRLIRFSNSSSS